MAVSDVREKAFQICKDYLGGAWTIIDKDDILIEKQLGGMVNDIFKLSLPPNIVPIAREPNTILMRNIVGYFDNGPFGIMTENIVVTFLAEKKLAPKLYGVFDGGRLEEFIPSRGLKPDDFCNPAILDNVVRKLARLHAVEPPITKNPYILYEITAEQLETSLNNLTRQIKNIPRRQEVWDQFLALNPREEWKWLMKMRDSSNSPIVFSHNDFYSNNILLRDYPSDDLVQLIDFEMSGYNFRGYDLACFFFSFCMDSIPEPPYFSMNLSNFPELKLQKLILKTYLEEFKKNSKIYTDIEKEEKLLLEEYKIFLLIFNFTWIVFCVFSPHRSKEPTDWMSIGELIIDVYIKQKKELLESLM